MRTFKLKEPEYRARFQEKLGDLTDIETWEDLKAKLRVAAEETCGFSKGKKKIKRGGGVASWKHS